MNDEENETAQKVRCCSEITSREKVIENLSSTKFCDQIKSESNLNHRQQVDFTASSHELESSTHQIHIHYHYYLKPEQENVIHQVAQNHGLGVPKKSSETFTAQNLSSGSSEIFNQSPVTPGVSDHEEEVLKLSNGSTENLNVLNNYEAQRVTIQSSEVVENPNFSPEAASVLNSSSSRAFGHYSHSSGYLEPRNNSGETFDSNSRATEPLNGNSSVLQGANSSLGAMGTLNGSFSAVGSENGSSRAFGLSSASSAHLGAFNASSGATGSLNASSAALGAFGSSSGNAGASITSKSSSALGFFNSNFGDQNRGFGGVELSQGSNVGLNNSLPGIAGASQNEQLCCDGVELVTPIQAFLVSSIVITVAYLFCLLNK